MHPDVPNFISLLFPTPDDFTCRGESVTTQWVKMTIKFLTFFWRYSTLFNMLIKCNF